MIKDLPKSSGEDTVVGENVRVTGKLQTSSNIQINGHVKGDVSSEGAVIVGKTAVIDGPINANDVKVEGTVKGNITARSQLELESQAKILGDIQVKTLAVKTGAVFNGKSTMTEEKPEVTEAKSEKKKKEPKKKEESTEDQQPKPELEIE